MKAGIFGGVFGIVLIALVITFLVIGVCAGVSYLRRRREDQ